MSPMLSRRLFLALMPASLLALASPAKVLPGAVVSASAPGPALCDPCTSYSGGATVFSVGFSDDLAEWDSGAS